MSFRVFIPEDTRKILSVTIHGYVEGLAGKYLKNILGTKLWETSVCIPSYIHFVDFFYRFECDSSVRLNLWKLGRVTLLEKSKEVRTDTFRTPVSSSLRTDVLTDNIEEGYYCHCLYILQSACDEKEVNYMSFMNPLEYISSKLSLTQKETVVRKIVQEIQATSYMERAGSLPFLYFLSQMNIPRKNLHKILPKHFTKNVFRQCASVKCIPKSDEGVFFKIMEKMYETAYKEEANFLSYCSYMYPFFGPEMSCKILSEWKSQVYESRRLEPKDGKYASNVLKSLVATVFEKVEPCPKLSKEISFVKTLLQSLSYELQIELYKELSSRKITISDKPLEVLHSACERKMLEQSRKGELIQIIAEWNKTLSCPDLVTDKLREKAKKYILESFDKAKKSQLHEAFNLLEKMCVDGTLFIDTDCKIQLLKKFSTSSDEGIHSLVAVCSKENGFHDIPNDDLGDIVLRWFDYALKYHCGSTNKSKKTSDSLQRLYIYLGKISLDPSLQQHASIMRKLESKAFDFLREFDIFDLVEAVPRMDKLENEPTETKFREHVKEFFEEGVASGDIIREHLYKHIKTNKVDSQ